MRRILFTGIALWLFITNSFSMNITINTWGGYVRVSMQELNEEILTGKKIARYRYLADGYEPDITDSVTEVKNAFIIGIEALYGLPYSFSAGLRAGYLLPNTGKSLVEAEVIEEYEFVSRSTTYSEVTLSLLPIMAGGRYNFTVQKFILSCGLFGGIGFAQGSMKQDFELTTDYTLGMEMIGYEDEVEKSKFDFNASGYGFAYNFVAGAVYNLSSRVALGIDLGYFSCVIKQMKADKDVDLNDDDQIKAGEDYQKDEPIKKYNPRTGKLTSDLEFDFSGLLLSAAVRFTF